MKLKLLLFFLMFSLLKVSAQGLPCRTTEENAKVYRDNPSSLKEKKDFDIFSKKFALEQKNKSSKLQAATYTVPVVFHIYGETQSGKSVTYQKIVNHLAQVNDDFNGRNADYQTVEPFFQARRSTLNIEFKLAKIDPSGGCTDGVVFHPAKNGYGNGGGYDAQIAADAWDNKKYINVYIQNDLYNDGSLTNSGVAWYPDTYMTNNNTARIVFNGAYLYDNSYSKEFSATLTHEFGHFFNLIHTFDGGCAGTDEVADTPKEDGNHTLACTPGTNCDGDKVNFENYMGYNGAQGCYKMYTQGQVTRMLAALQHPARITLWQSQNLIDTGVNSSGSALVASTVSFKEAVVNDGSFDSSSIVTLNGTKKFAVSSGAMIAGTHFTHTFPAGVTPVLTVNSNSQVTVTITGKATNHALANNASGGITFLPAAFVGGATGLSCSSVFYSFKYADPYGIFFVDMPDVVISSTLDWKFFEIAKGDDAAFGGWRFAANALKIETYSKQLVCETGTKNISLLAPNTAVGSTSNFTSPGAYPNQLDLRKADYTVWDGKTGYVGFNYLIDGATCYGWFKVSVNANGDGYTISEYAYNTQPGSPIYTGMTAKVAVVVSADNLYESETNDGSVTATSSISLSTNNGTFTKSSGTLVSGTDYTITGVPSGLTAVLTLQSNSKVVLTFTGKATSHVPANDAAVLITFKDAAITGGIAVLDNPAKTINVKFEAPYGIYYVNNPDYSASAATPWQYFNLGIGDDTEYGAWQFAAAALKIETYDKRLVTQAGTRNITLIPSGTSIGSFSNFVAPGAYPDQLDLRTATYTAWDNQTGYVGFEYTSRGRICYGWMHVKVEAGGVGFTVLDFAYNTKPNDPITTGTQTVVTVLAPTNLVAVGNKTALSANLTWVNNATDATNVIVERAGADNIFAEIAALASTATSYTNTGLVKDITYKYRVRAKKGTDFSDYSNVVTVLLTDNPVATLTKPVISDGGTYDSGFYAYWGNLVVGATLYDVEYKNPSGVWTSVGTTDSYTLWVPKVGTQVIYEFRVRAKNATEFSEWSNAIANLTDGTVVLSTANYNLEGKTFTMFPNPASDVVQFSFNNLDTNKITLTIYNVNGVVVGTVKNVTTYSVSHLAKGMYLVVATDGNFVETKKILVK
ncbi:M43 family zinc metalloprotease [Flavobacterium crassostreae]|uniref:M43 family zinc metalloprotease n=1 Tax=Flavobacterium crassostreae TaxID=1763534 RepID=UPI0008A2561D|nr:M43 family zinc metalloprotease [Flavobacterium crassostreae]